MSNQPPTGLASQLGDERWRAGVDVLEQLQARWRELLSGDLRYGPGDDFYARYYLCYLTPSLEAIGDEGWVERHVRDIA